MPLKTPQDLHELPRRQVVETRQGDWTGTDDGFDWKVSSPAAALEWLRYRRLRRCGRCEVTPDQDHEFHDDDAIHNTSDP